MTVTLAHVFTILHWTFYYFRVYSFLEKLAVEPYAMLQQQRLVLTTPPAAAFSLGLDLIRCCFCKFSVSQL